MTYSPRTKHSKSGFHLSFLCAVYLKYIIPINLVRPYPNIQYTKTQAVKTWLPFELFCAVHKVTLNSSSVVTWCKSVCGKTMDPTQPILDWLAGVHNNIQYFKIYINLTNQTLINFIYINKEK